jgi:hypothetical protein
MVEKFKNINGNNNGSGQSKKPFDVSCNIF